jgi:hypothetical protein
MARRRGWSYTEERLLIENYDSMTIKELEELIPGRQADSINCKIKRLKSLGKIVEGKKEEVIDRAYKQRHM